MNETPDDQETPPPAIWTDEVTAPPMIDIAEAAPPTDLPPIQIHAAEMIDEDVTVVDERSLPVKC
jgi:hypothetical protein